MGRVGRRTRHNHLLKEEQILPGRLPRKDLQDFWNRHSQMDSNAPKHLGLNSSSGFVLIQPSLCDIGYKPVYGKKSTDHTNLDSSIQLVNWAHTKQGPCPKQQRHSGELNIWDPWG